MKKNDPMLEKLSKSMDKLKTKDSKPMTSIPEQGTGEGKSYDFMQEPTKKRSEYASKSCSISLYPEDLQRIDLIREILVNNLGGNFSNSMIVRISLHTCSNDKNKLIRVYKDLKSK